MDEVLMHRLFFTSFWY